MLHQKKLALIKVSGEKIGTQEYTSVNTDVIKHSIQFIVSSVSAFIILSLTGLKFDVLF